MAVEATNALERQTLGMFDSWFTWLRGAGVPGYLGETSTPNSQKPMPADEVSKWLELLEKVYQKLDEAGPTIPAVTAHCASHTTAGGEGLKVYGPGPGDTMGQRNLAVAFEQAAVVEAHPPTADSIRGMNVNAGAIKQSGFSAASPGTYGTHYVYPDKADFAYLRSHGHDLARIPFRWERVQKLIATDPTANPPLKATELAHLKASFDAAAEVGMKVIPSVQNYAAYIFSTSIFGTQNLGRLGTTKLPTSAYGAFMRRFAQAFADHPAVVGYDIMNEPDEMPGGAAAWEAASQIALDKIREVDPDTFVWVSGYHDKYAEGTAQEKPQGIYSFVAHHPQPWISAQNFGYTTHAYYGPGAGYFQTYDQAIAYWQARGY